MDIILLLIRLLLAVIFIVSGLAKLVDYSGSRQAMLDFGVPAKLAKTSAVLLPLVELVVAGSLIPVASAWWGGLGSLALLLLFTAAVGYHLTRGHTPKCHCFGQASSEPIGRPTLVRNLILSALAGIIVGFGRTSAGVSVIGWLGTTILIQRVELGIGGLTVTLLLAGVVILLRLSRKLGHLLQQLDALEATIVGNGRKAMTATPSLAETHTPAPAFRLPDLSGNLVTLDALLSSGSPVLLIFSDPECGPCNSLLPEVSHWQRKYAGKLTLALISRGTSEANRVKIGKYGIALVLLQQDREVAEVYQAQGTPCAVLISSHGTRRSSLACGAEQIRELVAQAVGLPVIRPLPGRVNGATLPMVVPHQNSAMAALSSQPSGLQRGETAPVFTLPDLDGHLVSLADFRGKQALLLFWNPRCGFCQQMLADLKDWETQLPQEELMLLLVSTGDISENRALELRSPILLDEGFIIGPTLGVHGTPMAVLVDIEGKIASEVVAGAPAIFTLARLNQVLIRPGS